jgi:methylated-DNA-protein-cysteine methyltransferase related protein
MPRLDDAFNEAVYAVTRLIPKGTVATYGQVATYVISPRYSRAVGRALKNLDRARAKTVPWHRVLNAGGRVSARGEVERPVVQARLLKKEGIRFSPSGKVDLRVFGWHGPGPKWRLPFADPKPERLQRRVGAHPEPKKPRPNVRRNG